MGQREATIIVQPPCMFHDMMADAFARGEPIRVKTSRFGGGIRVLDMRPVGGGTTAVVFSVTDVP